MHLVTNQPNRRRAQNTKKNILHACIHLTIRCIGASRSRVCALRCYGCSQTRGVCACVCFPLFPTLVVTTTDQYLPFRRHLCINSTTWAAVCALPHLRRRRKLYVYIYACFAPSSVSISTSSMCDRHPNTPSPHSPRSSIVSIAPALSFPPTTNSTHTHVRPRSVFPTSCTPLYMRFFSFGYTASKSP